MGSPINIIGKRFGKLLVIKEDGLNKYKNKIWICQCDCGKITKSIVTELKSGHKRSCGCLKKFRQFKDLTGQKFGRLTVLYFDKIIKNRKHWYCRCDCGVEKSINSLYLGKDTKSCGCLKIETIKKMCGVNHPNWNFKLTDDDRKNRRNLTEYRYWSSEVKRLANYKCGKCNIGGKLESHHIRSWASDKNNRFNLDNGICLCKSCHKEFHQIFGQTNNTIRNLKDFLRNEF